MRKSKHLIALFTAVVMMLTFACGLLAACNKTYTITFDGNGGKFGTATTTTAETDKNGVVAQAPANPTREGYDFKGYKTEKNGGDAITFGENGYKFTGNTTVYAQWTAKTPTPPVDETLTITLDANGGKFAGDATTLTATTGTDGKLETLSRPTREGYEFKGYNTKQDGSGDAVTTSYVFSENTTIYAQWEEEVVLHDVEITLDPGTGTLPEGASNKVTAVDGKLNASELPEAIPAEGSNLVFVGWFTAEEEGELVTNDTIFTEDSTIYARYQQEVLITFDAGEGTLPEGQDTMLTTNGRLASLPTPTPNDDEAVFVGWFKEDGEEVTTETLFEEDAIIYAHYQKEVEITLEVGELGSLPAGTDSTMTTVQGRLQGLPTPVVNDERTTTFLGWFTAATDGEKVTEEWIFEEATTIYAQYKREYVITLEVGDGTLEPGAQTEFITVGGVIVDELPYAESTKDHWEFYNWYTTQTGGVEVVSGQTQFDADGKIYARYNRENGVWVGEEFKHDLTLNSGAVPDGDLLEQYWLGGMDETVNLTTDEVISIYINGKQISFWTSGSSGVKASTTSSKVSTVTATATGDFKLYVTRYYKAGDNENWVAQFIAPTTVNQGDKAPEGAAAIVINFGGVNTVTFYLVDGTTAIGADKLSDYCMYAWSDTGTKVEQFGDWNTAANKGILQTSMTSTVSRIPEKVIIRWGSGYGKQSGDTAYTFENGGHYVLTLKGEREAMEVTVLNLD